MLTNIVIGCVMMLATTVIHAACMLLIVKVVKKTRVGHARVSSPLTRVTPIAGVVLLMFIVSLGEASLWAGAYVALGAISGFEPALYFSTVTFTTLGYGDIVLDERWRLLAALEAANGIMMFGWTTAIVVGVVHRVYIGRESSPP